MNAIDSGHEARLVGLYARIALAAAALTFVVIVTSAYIRHTDASVHLARVAHRLAATGVLAGIIGMLLVA